MAGIDLEDRLRKAVACGDFVDLARSIEKATREEKKARPQIAKVCSQLMHAPYREARLIALSAAISLLADQTQLIWSAYEDALMSKDAALSRDAMRHLSHFVSLRHQNARSLIDRAVYSTTRHFCPENHECIAQAMHVLNTTRYPQMRP